MRSSAIHIRCLHAASRIRKPIKNPRIRTGMRNSQSLFTKPGENPMHSGRLSLSHRRILQTLTQVVSVSPAAMEILSHRIGKEDFHLLSSFNPLGRSCRYGLIPSLFPSEELALQSIGTQTYIYRNRSPHEKKQALADGLNHLKLRRGKTFSAREAHPLEILVQTLGLNTDRLAVVDTETTGLDPRQGAKILELAIMICNLKGEILESGNFIFLRPGIHIPEGALNVHGITHEIVEGPDAILPETIYRHLLRRLDGIPIIGQNLGFDLDMINYELQELNLPTLRDQICIDTLPLAKLLFPMLSPESGKTPIGYRLRCLMDFFKVEMGGLVLHRAESDIWGTLQTLIKEIQFGIEAQEPMELLLPLSSFPAKTFMPRPEEDLLFPEPKTQNSVGSAAIPLEFEDQANQAKQNRDECCDHLWDQLHHGKNNRIFFLVDRNHEKRKIARNLIRRFQEQSPSKKILWFEANQIMNDLTHLEALEALDQNAIPSGQLTGKTFASRKSETRSQKRAQVWQQNRLVCASLPTLINEIEKQTEGINFSNVGFIILGEFRDYLYRPLLKFLQKHPHIKVLAMCNTPGADLMNLRKTFREFEIDAVVSQKESQATGTPHLILRKEPVAQAGTQVLVELLEQFLTYAFFALNRQGYFSSFLLQNLKELSGRQRGELRGKAGIKYIFADQEGLTPHELESKIKALHGLVHGLSELNDQTEITKQFIYEVFYPIYRCQFPQSKAGEMVVETQAKILVKNRNPRERRRAFALEVFRHFSGIARNDFFDFLGKTKAIYEEFGKSSYISFWEQSFPPQVFAGFLGMTEYALRLAKGGKIEELSIYFKNTVVPKLFPFMGLTYGEPNHPPHQALRLVEDILRARKVYIEKKGNSEATSGLEQEINASSLCQSRLDFSQIEVDPKLAHNLDLLKTIAEEKIPKKVAIFLTSKAEAQEYQNAIENTFGNQIRLLPSAKELKKKPSPEGSRQTQPSLQILLTTSIEYDGNQFPADIGLVPAPVKGAVKLAKILERVGMGKDGIVYLEFSDGTPEGFVVEKGLSALRKQRDILQGRNPILQISEGRIPSEPQFLVDRWGLFAGS